MINLEDIKHLPVLDKETWRERREPVEDAEWREAGNPDAQFTNYYVVGRVHLDNRMDGREVIFLAASIFKDGDGLIFPFPKYLDDYDDYRSKS